MKANRRVREEHIWYTHVTHGTTHRVIAQHLPSGIKGEAVHQGNLEHARREARDDLQTELERRWLS
jgi:hypothetical protein